MLAPSRLREEIMDIVESNRFRYGLMALCAALMAVALQARAGEPCASCALSNASRELSVASGQVVQGSLAMVQGSGMVIVDSIAVAGEGSVVVLKASATGATASVRVTADVAGHLSNAVGQSVQVVAVSTGNLLVMSGKAVAFIPNEIGLALLHQNKLD